MSFRALFCYFYGPAGYFLSTSKRHNSRIFQPIKLKHINGTTGTFNLTLRILKLFYSLQFKFHPGKKTMLFDTNKLKMPGMNDALPGRATTLPVADRHFVNGRPLKPPFPEGMMQAVFGLGCFWGAERKFWQLHGVYTTASRLCRRLYA